MAGPSWMEGAIHRNIQIKYNENVHRYYATYDLEHKNVVGIALRAEALWEFGPFGLNISAQQQLNGLRNELAVVVGMNYGIVRDINAWGGRKD
jgi:hypothetical protein